uniref:Uncharacterized protein n=1 Tax=Acrobeloides nanus TaxID=290746 RepID=A0A914EIK1_9BILA
MTRIFFYLAFIVSILRVQICKSADNQPTDRLNEKGKEEEDEERFVDCFGRWSLADKNEFIGRRNEQ